ncbi:hypothetical protein BBFL7_00254 [Flavobacteria bacterium BBFL7]|nr:hypothetical protein BBFL7_00254 [Flavobacteria bacterium BBFL7]
MMSYNYLFICSANKDRSKTAEDYFSTQYPNLNFESAGTNKVICDQLGTNYITLKKIENAYKIFVMENKHRDAIQKTFGYQHYNKIIVLNIKDVYQYGSKDLIDVLEKNVQIDY